MGIKQFTNIWQLLSLLFLILVWNSATAEVPTTLDNTVSVVEDLTKTFDDSEFSFSDGDSDGFASIKILSLPTPGQLQYNLSNVTANQVILFKDLDDGLLKFIPAPNDNGTAYASFQFSVIDSAAEESASAIMTIDVIAQNDPPTAENNTLILDEDGSIIIVSGDFNFSDIDLGDTFTKISIETTVGLGTLKNGPTDLIAADEVTIAELNGNNLVFTPATNGNGAPYTNFTFRVYDSGGGNSGIYTMNLNVTSINDLPTSGNTSVDVVEDIPKTFSSGEFPFTDVDGGVFTKIQITNLNITGTLQLSSVDVVNNNEILVSELANLVFTPLPDENGNGYASFDFYVHDNTDYSTSAYSMTINVTEVDDPPTIDVVADPASIYEDAGEQTIVVTGISGGANESVPTVSVTSNNTGLIPTPTINYNSGTGTADVKYTPVANQNGSALITVSVFDGTTTIDESWTANVIAINDEPTINTVSNQSTNEDESLIVNLDGISEGPNESGQFITITAESDNTSIVPNGIVDYMQGDATGTITFNPAANAVGIVLITLTISDDGGTTNSGDDTKVLTFNLEIVSVNDTPELDDITSPAAINEDAGLQTIGLNGINDGDPELTQTLTITASSDNTTLVDNPAVDYTHGNSTATLSYTPKANISGIANIDVEISDGDKSIIKSFVITVDPINDPPTLDPIPNPAAIDEDASLQTVTLAGITPGPNESGQSVSVTASSNLTGIIPNPSVTYNGGTDTWSINYTPIADQFGDVIITVTVTDDDTNQKSTNQSFTQVINPVNDPPTLSGIGDVIIDEDLGLQNISFSGISDDGATPQNLTVTAVSDNITVIPNPTVNYTSPNSSGSLDFTANGDAFGTVNITVRVTDKDALFVEETFEVEVTNINDPPTLNDIPLQSSILEDAGPQSIGLTGISAGPNENETIIISASSDNPTLINDASVSFSGSTGTLSFTPNDNINGSATITVLVNDQQAQNNTIQKNVLVTVLPVNDIPIFDIQGNQAISENSGAQNVSSFAYNIDDGDSEDQTLSFEVILGAPTGNLSFVSAPSIDPASGDLTYTPTTNTNGNVTVNVTLRDNGGIDNGGINEASDSFVIYVTAVNEPPTFSLNGNPPDINEDAGAVTNASFAQNIDDGDPELVQDMQFDISQTSGTLTFSSSPSIDPGSGDLVYTVDDNVNGTATFNVFLEETVSGKFSPTTQFTITVNAVNDPPVGDNNAISTNEDETYTFQETDFIFSDLDNHAFNGIQITTLPVKGDLLYSGLSVMVGTSYPDVTLLTYTPGSNESGTGYESFGFKVRDESDDLSTTSYVMTIDVVAIADDPTSASSSINTPEDQNYTFTVLDFPFNDSDNQAFNGIIIQTNVATGTLLENATALSSFPVTISDVTKLVFQPIAGENGTPYTSFTFDVIDAGNATSESDSNSPYAMSINVGALNDPPTGGDDIISLLEDETYIFSATDFTFSDDDGHGFEGIQVTSLESLGSLKYDDVDVVALDECVDITKLTYSPPSNQNGAPLTTFQFKVRDNSGSLNISTATYTMTINVTAVNDAPIFTITEDPPAINEDDGAQTIASFISTIDDGDVDDDQIKTFSLSYTLPSTLSFATAPELDEVSGDLTYTPNVNSYGSVTIDVVLSDNGGTANGGVDQSAIQQFTITVNPINDQPTIDDITGTFNVDEDATTFNVPLSGISAGPNESQSITVNATSSDELIIPNPGVIYTSANATGQLAITPVANASGVVDITVTVSDGQVTNSTVVKTFQVTVNAIDDLPTLTAITDPASINEDADTQIIGISGISAGPNESQTLTVSASSSNTALIPTPTVSYATPDAIGSISYKPMADQSGSAEITVTVDDDGGQSFERKFDVVVLPINDLPTLDDLPASPIEISEDAGTQTLTLTGITAGGGESQSLNVQAVSDSPGIIPNPTIGSISSGQATLSYTPVANQNGLVKITVTIDDGQATNNSISKDFYVNIQPVNDPPTLSPISGTPFSIDEDSPTQNITLTGISAGGGEDQTLDIYAVSDDENIIKNPSISYTQGSTTASLSYTPEEDQSGSVEITVYVNDLSGINNLVSRAFTVNVNPVNDFPTINDIIDPADIQEDASAQTVSLSGITAGGGETQTVVVTAVEAVGADIIDVITVNYSGNNNASLIFTLNADANGATSIEVTVNDQQAVNNTVTKSFDINVLKVNDQPTLDAIPTPYTIAEDAGSQVIELTGIGQGPNENEQTVSVSVSSSNTALIPTPIINPKTSSTRDLIFTPQTNINGSSIITVTVNDGQSTNNTISRVFTVNVNAVNDIPTFDLQSDINIIENAGAQTINGYAFNINDGDPDLAQGLTFNLTVSGGLAFSTPPAISSANGNLSFTTADDSNGEATITVTLSDNGVPPESSVKSFKINALPLNGKPTFTLNGNPPNVSEDAGAINESNFAQNIEDGDPELNQVLTFNLLKISGDLTFESGPSINSTNGTLSYEIALNSHGSALISATLSDNGGETSVTQYFTIIVDPINDSPVGSNETAVINEDVPYNFQISDFNYTDVEGNPFSGIQIVSLEGTGDLEYNGSDVALNQICPDITLLVYKPALNFNGSDSFEFKLRDSEGMLSDTYTMSVTISAVDDNPTSGPAEVSTLENTTYTFKIADFPFNDPDGDTFSGIRIHSVETRGDLEYNGTDVTASTPVNNIDLLQFTPVTSENGTPYSTFEFEVKDSKNDYSVEYTMSINVGATNDRPIGANESVTILEDQNHSFQVSEFTFSDVDGHSFDGIRIETIETNGDLEYDGNDVTIQTLCPDVSSLVFKPDTNANGAPYAVFTFKVKDNSSSLNLSSADYQMTINVTQVNDQPVFTITSNPPAVNEDAGLQEVINFASSINDGDADQVQTIQFSNPALTSSTGNLSFSTAPTIDQSGKLSFRASANTNGSATYSVYLTDNGGTANGGQNQSSSQNFTIVVNSVNDIPTINPISDRPAISEDAATQTVSLANITAGPLESQQLSVSVKSSNESLIPTPTVAYTSPNSTGSISYRPAQDQSGTATITVTVSDGGSVNGSIEETFLVTVNPVNDLPTINDISDPDPILENSGEQIVNLDGVSAGGGESQTVLVTASSSNTSLIPTPLVSYLGGSTAQVFYTPASNSNGESTITITVNDQNGGIIQKTFKVTVSPVNDQPTLDPISNPNPIVEDSGEQQINLTGISPGANENQSLVITGESSNGTLISSANIRIVHTGSSSTGTLYYTANPNQFGTTVITVSVDDGLFNGVISRQFTVEVLPVADMPTVTNASTNQGAQSTSGLVIERNANDGNEVAYFKITNIQNGQLFMQDGVTEIINGEFITYEDGNLGLRFTPNSTTDGSFNIQSSLSDSDADLGGGIETATIFINSTPTSTNIPDLSLGEDTPQVIFDLYQFFDDEEDLDINLLFELNNTSPDIVNATISGQNLLINFLPNEFGVVFITIKCTDTKGAFVEDEIILTVTPVNDPPTFTSSALVSGDQDVEYYYEIETSDIESDDRYFEYTGPSWLILTDNGDGTATLIGTPGETENGDHQIELKVIESSSTLSATQPYTLTINNVNDPPSFANDPPDEVLETEKFEYNIEISDPDANDTYTVYLDPSVDIDWLVLSSNAPYTLEGFPPVGSAGEYTIKLIAIDAGGLVVENSFALTVLAPNKLPVITSLPEIPIEEGQSNTFSSMDFKNNFSDEDPLDSLVFITIVELPFYGELTLNGGIVYEGDTIYYNEINLLVYTPDQNFSGKDFFSWNASDGKSVALSAATVLFSITPIDDPPEILNVENNAIVYEFGDEYIFVTETAEVIEDDGDRIAYALFSISSNYNDAQDSLAIEDFDGMTTDWNDTTGVLTVSGSEIAEIYQDIVRSLVYINQKRFSPDTKSRVIELIVSDGGLNSTPVYREIHFEDTFIELDIPTGFTPDGQWPNNTWEIENIDIHDDAIVRVYSREGIMIYESIGQYKEWDGAYNGSVVKTGVYYYTIEIESFERKYSGTITVLR